MVKQAYVYLSLKVTNMVFNKYIFFKNDWKWLTFIPHIFKRIKLLTFAQNFSKA